MGNLANTHDTDRPELNIPFSNRLLQLLGAYYDNNSSKSVLTDILIELGVHTGSCFTGIIEHSDRFNDICIDIDNRKQDLTGRTGKITISVSEREFFTEDKDTWQLQYGLVNDLVISHTLFLTGKKQCYNQDCAALVQLAIPALKCLLSEQGHRSRANDLQSLIESLDDIIVEMNEQAVIKKIWVKDETKLFMHPDLFIGKDIMQVFGEFGKIFMNCIETLMITGERQECIYPDYDISKNHWYSAKFQKIDAMQQEMRVICVIEDITSKKMMSDQLEENSAELKRINLELLAAKTLAEQIARKRTETLSILSHEIRTPLNGIIGVCNLLSQTLFSDLQTIEYIDHLNLSSNHLLHLVNDILDLEKIESRKMELNETETNLVALVGNIKKQFLPMAAAKCLELNFYHNDDIPGLLMVDDLRLGRILNNLIGNAIKFTEKGEVNVILKVTGLTESKVSILFKISDTGIGIPDHLHNLVFDKFHQVQQASHRHQQGTGLGLSITRGLVNLFKSEIYLVSKPGEGTTFEFLIDFKRCFSHQVRKKVNPLAVGIALPDFELLIVDDNPVNLLVASHQLARFGIHADDADGGHAALEKLKKKQYDVILVDLHMPGMDGYQLAKEVQVHFPNVKIVIFTADILEEVKTRLKEMGISHILSKPFSPDEMYQVLLEVLNNK